MLPLPPLNLKWRFFIKIPILLSHFSPYTFSWSWFYQILCTNFLGGEGGFFARGRTQYFDDLTPLPLEKNHKLSLLITPSPSPRNPSDHRINHNYNRVLLLFLSDIFEEEKHDCNQQYKRNCNQCFYQILKQKHRIGTKLEKFNF